MARKKRTTIEDVAKLAGVSSMTVSRVLNNESKVSEKRKEKVLSAVKALNYRPNVAARGLASNKSFFLGLLYYDLNGSYVSQFLLSALKHCRRRGYHLVVDEVDDNVPRSLESIRELITTTQVDGMILLPPVSDKEEVISLLEAHHVPVVRVAPDKNLTSSPFICIDDYQAAFDITEYLIAQGHTRIAHIVGDAKQGASRMRYQGYLDALRSNGLSVPPEYIEQGAFTYKSGLACADKLLTLGSRPTAVFAANDEMAAAVVSVAYVNGLQVPKDLSVVGFDDAQLATTISPHLTTVRQPITEMARTAIDILASGKLTQPATCTLRDLRHILDFEIVERESVRALS
ncbi:LacI family DNA-binding transcriptional regulator [Aestuariibacter sp. A3R04]|uniref:LacI family DNA-binding transcriptional regulator n=1 Tax=Aestuariibacter sp. A3R04 TaxID=2841571 RepID=UPI001C086B3E|nr:LacI family DNA-binding transcriptional regulator [Aestuariibacter sp. A3R04]MBU3021661.1 LacI family DNA-binding transcriptional regulator [Aestuariibacter sp. A3R04]